MQDNQVDHLLIATFSANNYANASLKITLFFADNSSHLCIRIELPGFYNLSVNKKLKF